MIARACPRAISRPRKPAVAASAISAAIASGVVGIGDHSIIDGTDEGGVTYSMQTDSPLVDASEMGLERGGQQSLRRITRKREEQMPDFLYRYAVLEQRIIDRVGKWQIVQLEKAGRDEGKRVGGWQSAILIQAGSRFDEDLSSERRAALRLCLQEMQALRLSVVKDADHIIAAHRHVAMVLPAQTLDRRAIAAAMRVDPFRRVNLAEIARADRLGGRKLVLDQRGCRG